MGLLDDIRDGGARLAKAVIERVESAREPDVPFEQMQEALVKAGLAQPTDEKPRGLFHDPYSVYDWGGWREKPSALTNETLRMMAMKNTVIAAIIQVRVNQIAQFARPQQGRYDKGFRIGLRDRRDRKRSMTPAEQKEAAELERMFETTGFLLPDERPSSRDSFRDFIKKGVRDILTYDQWCFEKIRDRSGNISRFIALPSETIRPAVIDMEHEDPQGLGNRVTHVQVYEDSVIAEFSPDDIAWCVMNPRSDIRVNGFGFSPIEQLTNLVTAWLYGFEYNTRFFTQGSAVKGVLNVKGAIPDRQLKAFRRMWYSMVSGVQNSWRTPILNSDEIQWINMHSTNREMEFSAWMDWLTKLTCAVFGVDPVEINFQYGNTGQSQSLNTPDNEKKVVESKDKGLRPLMEHIQDSLNSHIVWEVNPDFEFMFSGIDADSQDKELDRIIKEAGAIRMIDEVRADLDYDPLPNDLGQVINNPTWMQNKQAADAMAAGDDGEGGEGGSGGPLGEEDGEDEGEAEFSGGPLGELPGFGDEDEEEEGAEEAPDDEEDEEEEDDFGKSLRAHSREVHETLRKALVRRRETSDRMIIDIDIPGGP